MAGRNRPSVRLGAPAVPDRRTIGQEWPLERRRVIPGAAMLGDPPRDRAAPGSRRAEDTRRALDQLPALTGYLFRSPKEADRPWTRFHARDLLERAEKLASLEPGGGFHAYRRKWATERKHLALKDVMEAGGWIDPRSLETCYQQVDEDTLLAVVTEPRKLRETANNTVHNTVHGNS